MPVIYFAELTNIYSVQSTPTTLNTIDSENRLRLESYPCGSGDSSQKRHRPEPHERRKPERETEAALRPPCNHPGPGGTGHLAEDQREPGPGRQPPGTLRRRHRQADSLCPALRDE